MIITVDSVYTHIQTDNRDILLVLSDKFRFRPKGYQYMPHYKTGNWDGYIKVFDIANKIIHSGLLPMVLDLIDRMEEEYTIHYIHKHLELEFENYSLPFDLYDYQEEAIRYIMKNDRVLCLSPTGSGKSVIIYNLIRQWEKIEGKTLLIVPNITLINQMSKDFVEYSKGDDTFDKNSFHCIQGGKEKNADVDVYISTWQSLLQVVKKNDLEGYWEQFSSVIVDEAHQAGSKAIMSIMERLNDCPRRVGLTGTLSSSDMKVSAMQLIGLFGNVYKTISTQELIETGRLSKLSINSILLDYNNAEKFADYHKEIAYLTNHKERAKFISRLSEAIKGNTIILFNFIAHGELIYDQCLKDSSKNIYWISGKTKGKEREEIRKIVEDNDNCIIIGGVSVIGTGFSIKNIHNMILAHPSKSRIRTLQSIGRALRKLDSKDSAIIYDIGDSFSYSARHLNERIKHYKSENLPYTLQTLRI
jgi:superfamily II DNA or RNA helicase